MVFLEIIYRVVRILFEQRSETVLFFILNFWIIVTTKIFFFFFFNVNSSFFQIM